MGKATEVPIAEIGRRLVRIREAMGLNQSQFASLIDMSPQRWGNYERGTRTPKADVLGHVWRVTGASADYILFGRPDAMPLDLAVRMGLASYLHHD
jgi:transcriptional regulator with XRE-family HTH domain